MEWRIDASAPSAWSELQAAAAQARAGDVLRLSAGRLVALHALVPPAGVTVAGEPGSSLVCSSHEPAIVISADGVCVTGLRVEAHSDGQTLMRIALCAGARILDCEFDGLGLAGIGIDVDRATDVLIEGCRVHDCSDGDVPDRAGILFRSAQGAVRSSSVIRACSGIRGQRSPDARHLASHLEVQSCTVVEPLLGGIVFSSSTGLAEDNECRGSRKSAGIVVRRDPRSPDAPSEVTLGGNRCHDNEHAGIAFLSSSGMAEDNECWASRNYSGIVVQRDPESPDAPSDVTLRGNRCHDNEQDGICFLSSQGLAEDNECWGSRTGVGIDVRRDPKSPAAPSDVTLRGNRCHDNEGAGIGFFSSQGLAEDNQCWGSRTSGGIVAHRASSSPDAPSDVTLRGNRCHDNEQAGIAFLSSQGAADANECWGNRTSSGIVAQRDPDSPDAPSDVMLRGNRCHDNEQAGILFVSSHGLAEDNECWGSRTRGGIVAQRGPDSPDAPSDVMLRGNRCHDNEQAGITFSSSQGAADANECWGSRTNSGIVAQRGADAPDAPSDVTLRGNRCHDNELAGIAFYSSHGSAEDNECWGNRTGDGIVAHRDPRSPKAPSDVTLRGNRCHDNAADGIVFLSSNGLAEDNECWANKVGNEVALHASPDVKVVNHFELPRRPPPELRLAHHAAHPLRAWLSAGPEPEQRHRLADFLWSGCGHCLASWLGARLRGPQPEPPPEPAKVPHLFTMSAAAPADSSVRTARAPLVKLAGLGATTPPEPGLPMLDALLARVGALEHARRSKRSAQGKPIAALREPVALVSADTPALEDWLKDEIRQKAALARRRPPRAGVQGFRLTVLDGLGHDAGQSAQGGEAGFVAASLLQGRAGWRKVLTGLRAVVQAPLDAVGISLLMLIVGLVASTWLMVPANGSPLEPALGQLMVAPTDVPTWHTLLEAVGSVWRTGVEEGAWKTNFGTLLLCVFLLAPPLTRLLPAPLNPVTELLIKLVLGPILGIFGYKDSVEAWELQHRLRRVLSRWLQSQSATRHWLRREIYGEPLFAALWRRRWPLALVVVRGVDAPSQAQQKELREVMALCPRRHHLLVVMQMPGLAMVTGGFLDTWFTRGQVSPTQAWLIHDRTSIDVPVAGETEHDPEARERLRDLLGWGASNDAVQLANTLGDKSHVDLHPLLVLGSTAHAHLALSRVNKADSIVAGGVWRRWQRRLWALNKRPPQLEGDWLTKQDEAAQRGNALLLVQDSDGRHRAWVGRAGWRRELAAALQATRVHGPTATSSACWHAPNASTCTALGATGEPDPRRKRRMFEACCAACCIWRRH